MQEHFESAMKFLWEALTGARANKKSLDKAKYQSYKHIKLAVQQGFVFLQEVCCTGAQGFEADGGGLDAVARAAVAFWVALSVCCVVPPYIRPC